MHAMLSQSAGLDPREVDAGPLLRHSKLVDLAIRSAPLVSRLGRWRPSQANQSDTLNGMALCSHIPVARQCPLQKAMGTMSHPQC